MRPLTLNQAAKVAHKSKAAILEAIRSGRLSAARDDLNQWQIDPAELFRVYPQDQSQTGEENRDQPPEENRETAFLSAKIDYLERERRLLESTIDDLKTDRDQWRQQATALLTHQREPTEADDPRPAPKRSDERLGLLWSALTVFVWVAMLGAVGFGLAVWWPSLNQP